jgi:phage shock protein C
MQDSQQIVHQAAEFDDGPDKLFGVCLTVGDEFGFNPFYLRVALIALMVVNPIVTTAAYAALGTVVLMSHLIFPKPSVASAAGEDLTGNEERTEQQLPLAA